MREDGNAVEKPKPGSPDHGVRAGPAYWDWFETLVEQGEWSRNANRQVGYQIAHYAGSDGDPKDRRNLCLNPVQVTPTLRIPKCMQMISADDVVRRIEMYYQGEALRYADATVRSGEPATTPT